MKGLTVLVFIILLTQCLYSKQKPKNFIKEANWIYNVLACGNKKIPRNVNKYQISQYCIYIKKRQKQYKKIFLKQIQAFLKKYKVRMLPDTIVYPFGGNDLSGAIAVFPHAREITTISLEHSGDPRVIIKSNAYQFSKALKLFKYIHGNTLTFRDNSNANVIALEKGIIPGQLALSITAAELFGYKPVSLYYFTFKKNGSIHYYNEKEIKALRHKKMKKLYWYWKNPIFSIAFKNMEIVYKRTKKGSGPLYITHRHIAANLNNKNFNNSPLQKHLLKKGKVTAITKGASYLMWFKKFSGIRNYLLNNMVFMIQDATGILPVHTSKAGFKQITYGKFYGAFLKNKGGAQAYQLRKFFRSQPYRPLKFRFGHADIHGAYHLMIVLPKK